MVDRATFVRDSMRRFWAGRTQTYAEIAAPNTGAHAEALLARMHLRPGERVLDVATGPGTVAFRAARLVGQQGSVMATDLTPEWEELIQAQCQAEGVANVTFKVMGAEALELPDDSFDVALCQFGLMFLVDPVQALREMRRVLRPGGRLGVVVWSTPDKVLCFSAVNQHLAPYVPQLPPEEQLPTPLSLGEPGLIERHVVAAGFQDVRTERQTLDFVIQDPETTWRDRTEQGAPALREAIRQLPEDERRRLHDTVIAELERYRRDGAIRLPSEAIYVTATK